MILLTLCVRHIYISGCSAEHMQSLRKPVLVGLACSHIRPRAEGLEEPPCLLCLVGFTAKWQGDNQALPVWLPAPSVPMETGTWGPKGPYPPAPCAKTWGQCPVSTDNSCSCRRLAPVMPSVPGCAQAPLQPTFTSVLVSPSLPLLQVGN